MAAKTKACRCPPTRSRRTAQERLAEMARAHAASEARKRKESREQCPMCRAPMAMGAEFGAPFANEAACPKCGWNGVVIG